MNSLCDLICRWGAGKVRSIVSVAVISEPVPDEVRTDFLSSVYNMILLM